MKAKSFDLDDVLYANKRLLASLSRMSCAMIKQSIEDMLMPGNESEHRTSARQWLQGAGGAGFNLQQCCTFINLKLIMDGSISSVDDGLSVETLRAIANNEDMDQLRAISKSLTMIMKLDSEAVNEAVYTVKHESLAENALFAPAF